MKKIILENTREHDITLSIKSDTDEYMNAVIPAAKQDTEDRSEIINGRAEVDDTLVNAAKKQPVVAFYFDENWLRVVGEPSTKQSTKQSTKD